MRKIIIAVITLAAAYCTQAQVYMQTMLPAVGLVQKNQLWNLVVINGTTASMEGKLVLMLRDRQSGLELLTATTSRFTLPKGSLPVNINNLSPIQYNYIGMAPGNMLNNLLPVGSYSICYSFFRVLGEKEEQLAEECAAFDVEPLSPPMLIFPADSSALETSPAQFTWTPPAPAGMMDQLRYEVLVTEIKPGQQPAEALQQNMSFYNTANLINNFITYPAALPAFEKEKWYSWQVVARDGKNYAGKSEVWVFKIKNEKKEQPAAKMFVTLSNQKDDFGTCYLQESRIGIRFYSFDPDYKAKIKLLTAAGNTIQQLEQEIIYGDNMFVIELNNHIKKGETYRLTLATASGAVKSLLITIAL